MPRKEPVKKGKMNRAYLSSLLESAGATDEAIAETVAACLKSPDLKVRAQALDIAAHWKGFYDVDKSAGEEVIEPLPIQGISEASMLALIGKSPVEDKCKNCGYRKYASKKVPAPKELDNEKNAVPLLCNEVSKLGDEGTHNPSESRQPVTPEEPANGEDVCISETEEVTPELLEAGEINPINVENIEEESNFSGGGEEPTR